MGRAEDCSNLFRARYNTEPPTPGIIIEQIKLEWKLYKQERDAIRLFSLVQYAHPKQSTELCREQFISQKIRLCYLTWKNRYDKETWRAIVLKLLFPIGCL